MPSEHLQKYAEKEAKPELPPLMLDIQPELEEVRLEGSSNWESTPWKSVLDFDWSGSREKMHAISYSLFHWSERKISVEVSLSSHSSSSDLHVPCGPHGSRLSRRATTLKSRKIWILHFQRYGKDTAKIRRGIAKMAHFKARKTHHFKARKWMFLHRKISQNVTISSPKWCFRAYDLKVFLKKGRRAEGEPYLLYTHFAPATTVARRSSSSSPLHPTSSTVLVAFRPLSK